MKFTCEFCNNTFTSSCNLITHKRTAKYCLALRGENTITYECEKCCQVFCTKPVMKQHEKKCKTLYRIPRKIQNLLNDKDLEIKTLQEEITKLKLENATLVSDTKATIYEKEYHAIKDKPTYTTNTTTTNKLKMVNTATIDPFTIEAFRARLARGEYTYDTFVAGNLGIKRFILGVMTKDDERNYVTTDTSRENFHRLEETRKWINDKGAGYLNKMLDEMKPVVQEHWDKFLLEGKNTEDKESYHIDLDRVKPLACAIIGKSDCRQRTILLDDVIKHIKPRVAI